MFQFLLGSIFGNLVGMYLAQNYDIPNLAKELEEIKKDLDAKKKPPSSFGQLQRCLQGILAVLFSGPPLHVNQSSALPPASAFARPCAASSTKGATS
ncbi:uncharacterized protein WM277_004208 [Molossus nigricans]